MARDNTRLILGGLLFVTGILACCSRLEASGQLQRPKICLALSGGGARGSAHIGVLKVLEREGIPIDCIAGASFGALVGGLYAIGYSVDGIEQILAGQDWDAIFSNEPQRRLTPLIERRDARYQAQLAFNGWNPELPSGLLGGQRLAETLDALTAEPMLRAHYDFDRLPIPFRAVATNLVDGKAFVFREGSMAEALRASMAVPMLFTPIEKDGMLLVDGGLTANLPTGVARAMGADIVIAVDATSPLLRKDEIRTFINVIDQSLSLRMEQNQEENRKLASIVLKPELDSFTFNDFNKTREIVARGEQEAARRLEELKALVAGIPPRQRPALPEKGKSTIDSIAFRGLKKVRQSQIESSLHVHAGEAVNPGTISADVGRIYATGLFDGVEYTLEPAGENRYRLVYSLKEAPLRTLGASLRYDNDYDFVALVEFTERQIFGGPSKATLSSQFGGLSNHSAALRLVPSAAPFFFAEPRLDLRRLERRDVRDEVLVDKFTDRREGGQLLLGGSVLKQLEISGGYRAERVRIAGGSQPNRLDGSEVQAGLMFLLNRDTLDFPDFPRSGMVLRFQVDKRSKRLGGDYDYSKWQADYQRSFPVSKSSTLQISAAGGYLHGDVPFYDLFFTGGNCVSEGASRRFVGLERDEVPARQMAVLGASFRHQLFSSPLGLIRRGYLTAGYSGGYFSSRQTRPYDFNYINGAGIGLALDTMLGPIRIAGGWAESSRFNVYFSLGPAF